MRHLAFMYFYSIATSQIYVMMICFFFAICLPRTPPTWLHPLGWNFVAFLNSIQYFNFPWVNHPRKVETLYGLYEPYKESWNIMWPYEPSKESWNIVWPSWTNQWKLKHCVAFMKNLRKVSRTLPQESLYCCLGVKSLFNILLILNVNTN